MTTLSTQQFIAANLLSDLKKLVLLKRSDTTIDYEFAFRQIDGLQRIQYKIPSFYHTSDILFPPHLNVEQSSSESTALYKKALCEGDVFVDITGGFGIDFYFISQHFKKAIYVEQNAELCEIVAHNLVSLKAVNYEIIQDDANHFIEIMPLADCVFVDPARRSKTGAKTVFLQNCEPDITLFYKKILEKSKQLVIKLSPMLDISAALKSLQFVKQVHVVSVGNECKEVLLVLYPNYEGKIEYYAVNILKNNQIQRYVFDKEQEAEIEVECTNRVLEYLYEPISSILKAGAFKIVTRDFGIKKLHKNTHLYTSDALISDFPGRIFNVNKVWETGKKEMAILKKQISKANISTRNFPLKPDELKKKIGIADGGATYLFGCTIADEQKVIIECQKVTLAV